MFVLVPLPSMTVDGARAWWLGYLIPSRLSSTDLITPCTVGPSCWKRKKEKREKKGGREEEKDWRGVQGRVLLIYVVVSVKRRASINHPRASRGSVGPSSETRATRIDSSDKRAGEDGRKHGLDNSTVSFVRLETWRDGA